MRALALAAILGVGMTATPALARPWTDPAGRITIDVPAGWVVTSERTEGFSHVIAGNANNECQFVATPNANSANSSADAIRRAAQNDAQFADELWISMGNAMPGVFPASSASVTSRSRDDAGFWPVQRALMQSSERAVHGGLQLRPGMDIRGFCLTYGGAEPLETYNQVLRTMGHPNDATFQADAERQAAERAARETAATAAAATAPQQEEQSGRRRRNNNDN